MKHVNSMKLIPALLLVAFSGGASASGFQLLEQNASGIANAYAGSAAVADNASTIFFNPAGMTQLQAREVSGGLSVVNPSFTFDNKGSSVGAAFPNGLAGTGDGGNAGGWAFIPNGYLSWALSKDLYIGVGVGAPFGLKTEYDNPWVGAAQSVSFEVKTYNVNPSIAYRVNETVSLGLGVNWQRVEATYKRQAGTSAVPGLASAATVVASPVELTLDDDAWGWNVGALFTLSPSTKVGVSYRSTMQYHTNGKIKVSGISPTFNNATSSNAKADIELPYTFIMSVTQKFSDKWEKGIFIRNRTVVNFECKISMPQKSKIVIEKGSTLIIGGTITNDCEQGWEGTIEVKRGGTLRLLSDSQILFKGLGKIVVDKKKSKRGKVIVENGAKILLDGKTLQYK